MTRQVRMTCAGSDRAAAGKLAATLRETGADVAVQVDGHAARDGDGARVDALLFLVSGASVASAGCLRELERAVAADTRVVPVVLERVEDEHWPAALADREWVLVGADGRDAPWLRKLVVALEVDPRARDLHERIAARAAEWDVAKRDRSLLLRGSDLLDAEAWRGDQATHGQAPTGEEALYIAESRRAAGVRQRTRFGAVLAALVVTVALAVVALVQRHEAGVVQREATSRGLAAQALTIAEDDPALAAALSVEAQRVDATPEAADAARAVLGRLGTTIGTLSGHTDSVVRVAYGPRSDRLASASSDGTVRIWDIPTRSQVGAPLRGHGGAVNAIAYSRDGRIVASGGADGTVRLWSVARHRAIGRVLRGHKGTVSSVAFSPDGRRLASAGDDATVRLWDVPGSRAAGQPLPSRVGAVFALAFSPDGRRLAWGGADTTIRVWDIARRAPAGAPLRGHTKFVQAVAFSPDGRMLASGSLDETARLWDLGEHRQAGAPLRPTRPPLSGGLTSPLLIGAVAFSPDGRTLATADSRAVRRWDVATHAPVGPPLGGNGSLTLSWSPDGMTLAAAGLRNDVVLSNVAGSAPAVRLLRQPLNAIGPALPAIAFSADGRTRVSGGDDGALRRWRVADNAPLGPAIVFGSAPVRGIATTADGALIASGSDDGTVRLWNAATQRQLGATLRGHVGRIWSVAFSRDAKILASGGEDKLVRLWDVASGRLLVAPLRGHTSTVNSLAFSPDGATLASAGGGLDASLRLWRVATGKPIGTPLRGHIGAVQRVIFSPDGRLLASSSLDRTIRLWDVATRRVLGAPLTGLADVKPMAFSPDSKTLASAGSGADVRLWDVASHAAIGPPLTQLGNGIGELAFSPDGSELLVADGADNEATVASVVWSADAGKRATRLCASARRDLTRAEWRTYLPGRPYRRTCSAG